MKKTWSEILAKETLKQFITDNKTIIFKGKATLRQCGAADFLAAYHGYIISSEVEKEEN